MKKINLIGMKFGRLTVIKEAGRDKWGKVTWNCRCDCGIVKIVAGYFLRRGDTNSCGCWNKEVHLTHGMSGTKTYESWQNMVARCTNPNNKDFKNYGGRGITICKRWLKFENFFADMGNSPKGLTIERKNNNLGYSKENCCWDTRYKQSQNRRPRLDNTTGVDGCSWNKQAEKYRVRICANDKHYFIGHFETLDQAATARGKAEKKYWR